jgi:serpin B
LAATGSGEPKDLTSHLVDCNTQFAFDLYGQLKGADGNLFFSPFSISTAMAMTYAGARGQTADQMRKALCIHEMFRTAINPNMETVAYGQLIDQLNDPNRSDAYQLSVANALWAQKGYPFLDTFVQLNNQYYHAGLENVDFINDTETSRQTINQWVEEKTNEKIKNLIPQGAVNAMTRLVLTNAIYFKGEWAESFDKARTQEAPFFCPSGGTVQAPLMTQKEKFGYGETDTLQLLQLPYKGQQLSMLVLLPKHKDGLGQLESQLTAETLVGWQSRLRKKEVIVYLPKFKMTSQFSLNQTLSAMGMSDAFDLTRADFSGMTGTKDLFLSAVLHKAFVEVNEEGTEAAAATGGVISTTSVEIAPPPIFLADHPFVFLIQDNNTKSILFLGRVTDPTKKQ